MNLLTDAWIPIQHQNNYRKISLQQLLCGEQTGELCLPRDDMELACLQLLSAMAQILFLPTHKKELLQYLKDPIRPEVYVDACQDKMDWFDLNHSRTPFMQFRNVTPSKTEPYTGMDKLLAGVADGANKVFVNPQDLGAGLCGSCTAIALFNMANNAPSVGGGFQGSFRGNTPITVLVKGRTLRETVWLNVLTEENIEKIMPWYQKTKSQQPNYVDKDNAGVLLDASMIGLTRGILWQPARYELYPPIENAICSCCGCDSSVYINFKKEKFKYSLSGYWPHPLSATKYNFDKDDNDKRINVTFNSFTTSAPAWTHLSSFLFLNKEKKEGGSPAPVIEQVKSVLNGKPLNLIIGGYRYKPPQTATITARCHELFSLSEGWHEHEASMRLLITTAVEYKQALRKGLYSFVSRAIINPGSKKNKDRIGEICSLAEAVYYQQTENMIRERLAAIKSQTLQNEKITLNERLKSIVISLFNQATEPYSQEPKMLKALGLARRSLHKFLQDLEPKG